MGGGANARGVDVAACEARKGARSLVAAGESVERLPSCGPGDGAAEALARSGQDVFWDIFPRFRNISNRPRALIPVANISPTHTLSGTTISTSNSGGLGALGEPNTSPFY